MAIASPLLLTLGSFFVAIPIVLHLVMRRKPTHLVFPAIRFVKQRRESNRRRLQLRHWLLLMLRCLAILVVAAALARPRVSSALVGNWLVLGVIAVMLTIVVMLTIIAWMQRRNRLLAGILTAVSAIMALSLIGLFLVTFNKGKSVNIGGREAPVAAVVIIDTSPRMEYRQANQTRLEHAQEIARWLVRQMPSGSQVAVVDSRVGEPFFSVDVGAARKQIDVLQTTFVTQPLVTTLDKSIRLVRDSEIDRQEIYLLSDLTEQAWNGDAAGNVKKRLEKADQVSLYVIDVGVDDPQNFALGELELESESMPKNGELQLSTSLSRIGTGSSRNVQLHLEKPDLTKPVMLDGKLQLPEEHWVRSANTEIKADSSQQIEFQLGGLDVGVHQGYVQIVGEDGLALDDRRYLTIEVKDAWPVLVVEGKDATSLFVQQTLAPSDARDEGKAQFSLSTIKQEQLINEDLSGFSSVCLLDPGPMTPLIWGKLHEYVNAGGGLAIYLGHNAVANDSFNGEAAQSLLPGTLAPIVGRTHGDLFLTSPASFTHPLSAAFQPFASSVPWAEFPIFRYWTLRRGDDTHVIFQYGNNRPALVERRVGSGRVLLMTTPVSDVAYPEGRHRWNNLVLGNWWPCFAIIKESFQYLVGTSGMRLNYTVNQTATLDNDEDIYPLKYDMFTPSGPVQSKRSEDNRIVVASTKIPGAYRFRGSRGGPVVRGFSINLDENATDLTRTKTTRLDEVLGEGRYQLARNQEEIDRGQREGREGRQFYPLLVGVLAIVLGLELLMANRFYSKEE